MKRIRALMSESEISSVPFLALYLEIVDDLLKNDQADVVMYKEAHRVSVFFF